MRLLIWHEHTTAPGQGGGGAESLLRDLMAALRNLGHEVVWWNGQGDPRAVLDDVQPDLVQVQTIHNAVPHWLESARWLQASGLPNLWALMDYWPFCHGRMLLTHSTAGEPCHAVTGLCDRQCACQRSPAEWLEVVNGADAVVTYNEHTAAIMRRHGLRVSHVVELGVDTEAFAPEPGRRQVGSVWASSAWPEFAVKGMSVLRAAVQGTGIDVSLMAHLPRERVAEGLKLADLYVFPSTYEETWGLCLCEALASGCACIASDVAGARAQVHASTGVLVAPRDPQALRAAIQDLLGDESRRRRLGEAARAHAEQEHSLAAMGRRWETVYREVLNGR